LLTMHPAEPVDPHAVLHNRFDELPLVFST
jgi:hypothetical protein